MVPMNGAESLVRTLVACGVEVSFTNPGTSEMHFVAALDKVEGMRCVLGLFEGVVTGAADGYGRMLGRPASTLLHLGPGLANGLANLHNASRAQVPIVNIIGDHATYHKRHDAPLTADIEALAKPYSRWLRSSATSKDVAGDGAEAVARSRHAPGQITTLILPADTAWGEGGEVAKLPDIPAAPVPADATIERAAAMLKNGLPTGIVLGGKALHGRGLIAAGRISAGTGALLMTAVGFPRIERGAGRPLVERIPYVIDHSLDYLKQFRQLILVGIAAPVAFFAYPDKPSVLSQPGTAIHTLARPGEDYVTGLEALATALSLHAAPPAAQPREKVEAPSGAISLPGLAQALAALIPENAIVVDESITSGRNFVPATRGAPPHDWMTNTGGSIGIALPLATGAAIACPDRPVLCLSADGSAMYTLQALWTMARESLNVTTILFNNRAYQILLGEYANVGAGNPGRRALDMLQIGRPDLDFVALAHAMGVPGVRATSLDELMKAARDGLASGGPNLVEVML
jgi:acetolactate synthase I/II/III large subunit